MSILNAVKAWNDIEKFKEELHTYPDEIIHQLKMMIYDEESLRVKIKLEKELHPEFLPEELEMTSSDGIRAYRLRTGIKDLKLVFELWKRVKKS